MRRLGTLIVLMLLSGLLLGCGDPSKSQLLDKAKGAATRDQLRSALGEPDDLAKIGPLEKWTYSASDGEVIYIITGDSVTLELAGGQSTQ